MSYSIKHTYSYIYLLMYIHCVLMIVYITELLTTTLHALVYLYTYTHIHTYAHSYVCTFLFVCVSAMHAHGPAAELVNYTTYMSMPVNLQTNSAHNCNSLAGVYNLHMQHHILAILQCQAHVWWCLALMLALYIHVTLQNGVQPAICLYWQCNCLTTTSPYKHNCTYQLATT